MSPTRRDACTLRLSIVAVASLVGLGAGVQAQDVPASSSATTPLAPSSTAAFGAPDPSPYYIGASQALTHDSNVYRVPNGQSDNYSSTSLLAGFDQPISRQRVFGRAEVSVNRYQREDRLNNTSYNLNAGADLETIENLSGNLRLGLSRNLAAPSATSVNAPTAQRNIMQFQSVDARARWGGPGLLSLEGSVGYVSVDQTGNSAAADSTQQSASLGINYHPGGPLRVGVAARGVRTRTPDAIFDPATGSFRSNTSTSKNLDFLAVYRLTGLLSMNGRLSYTQQDNSGISDADFSGVTGNVSVRWQPTGKTSVNFLAGRDTGFDLGRFDSQIVVLTTSTPVVIPVSATYENNRVTDFIALGAAYSATAKVNVIADARYSRAKLLRSTVTSLGATTSIETTDSVKTASLGVNYAATRYLSATCSLAREDRDVSGGITYSYVANRVSCLAQFTWR